MSSKHKRKLQKNREVIHVKVRQNWSNLAEMQEIRKKICEAFGKNCELHIEFTYQGQYFGC